NIFSNFFKNIFHKSLAEVAYLPGTVVSDAIFSVRHPCAYYHISATENLDGPSVVSLRAAGTPHPAER
ncbi:MAG TPA: hypothetical protein VLA52_01400, partial [Thermohalobaculum sp.]|nr:hypothetical protein [Thermohalobaculum sp.]